jgi:hypothetical protein
MRQWLAICWLVELWFPALSGICIFSAISRLALISTQPPPCWEYWQLSLCGEVSTLKNTWGFFSVHPMHEYIWGCIHKFLNWPPGVIIANGTALCHYMQLYQYFVSQTSEFCCNNLLCCFSTSVCCCLFHYQLSLETCGYTLVHTD